MSTTKLVLTALVLASSVAGAQGKAKSQERYPRHKEMPAKTDTVYQTQTRTDTVYRTTTRVDTLRVMEAAAPMTAAVVDLVRSGLYAGVGGSVIFPQGNLEKSYGNGYGAKGFVGYKMAGSPLGLRLDLVNWARPKGKRYVEFARIPDANFYSATANVTLETSLGGVMGVRPSVYAIAGGGVHYLKDFRYISVDAAGHGSFDDEDNMNYDDAVTRPSLNAGAGIAVPMSRSLDLFVEGQYVTVHDNHGWETNYVPVTAGVRMFF